MRNLNRKTVVEGKGLILLFCLCLWISAFPVYSGDGQIDILPGGKVTFTISKPGSYVLTDNVTMTANLNCIQITADDVTLDLNGHTIKGTDDGSAVGIYGKDKFHICVQNGRVEYFGSDGIRLGDQAHVKNVMLHKNDGNGLKLGGRGIVQNVISTYNGKSGIYGGNSCLVEKCVSSRNCSLGESAGISVYDNSTVRDCILRLNTYEGDQDVDVYGISSEHTCLIENNTIRENKNNTTYDGGTIYGIYTIDNTIIRNNTCSDNTASGAGTDMRVIKAGKHSTLSGNVCSMNSVTGEAAGLYALESGEKSIIMNNTVSDNSNVGNYIYGIYARSDSIIRNNVASGHTAKFSAYGIYVPGDGSRVENNNCSGNVGTEYGGYGIYIVVATDDCVVLRNHTRGNSKNGIYLGNGTQYCAENMTAEPNGIKQDGSNSLLENNIAIP